MLFQGTKVVKGAMNAEVHLAMQGGDQIVASITNASVDHLGLKQELRPRRWSTLASSF